MEEIAKHITVNISHAAEMLAALIIAFAVIKVLFSYFFLAYRPAKNLSKERIRIEFGTSVAVALELLLGADVLATAVAPSWGDIGKLASIAILRTALNYFLGKELDQIKTKNEL
jgi:uncharacterized membrane protein